MNRFFYLLGIIAIISACQQSDSGDELDISVPVSVEDINKSPIEEYVTTTSTVYAIKNTVIQSETEGVYRQGVNALTKKPYITGDRIDEGDIIVLLDNPEYENNIKVESQKLNLDISKREFEKQQSLYEKGGVTLRELINAERTYVEARYAYENALIQLDKMKITAPFSGVIVDLPYYTPGTKIQTGQKIVEIMDYSRLYAEVFYPAKELNRIRGGLKLRVTHYSEAADTLWGEITQVAPALDPETRSFKATLLIENESHSLRPGMFVKVETRVAERDSAIVIPKDVILSKRSGKTVFVVDRGAAFERVIRTGLENENRVEVLEGLKENERLVVKGFETLRNRSKVKIVR